MIITFKKQGGKKDNKSYSQTFSQRKLTYISIISQQLMYPVRKHVNLSKIQVGLPLGCTIIP